MKLKSTTRTAEMGRRVLLAFEAWNPSHVCFKPFAAAAAVETAFEHDQWWVICKPCGASWSVHDAVGGDAVDGFGFEQVSEGEHA